MSVEFNEQNDLPTIGNQNTKGITGWLINKGIVKDVKGAQYLLVTIMIICFGLTGFLLMKQNSSEPTEETLSEYEIQQLPKDLREALSGDNLN